MVPWALLDILKNAGAMAIKHWRIVLVAFLALLAYNYVKTAEAAKDDLELAKDRAAVAESLATHHQAASGALTQSIDSLKGRVAEADTRWRDALARLKKPSAPVQPGPSSPVLNPTISPDSTAQEPSDSTSADPIQELIKLCDARVAVRDSVIKKQDERHVQDSLTIRQLKIVASVPPTTPPQPPSRLSRVLLGAGAGLAGGVIAQQVTGQKGLIISVSVGTLLGLLR